MNITHLLDQFNQDASTAEQLLHLIETELAALSAQDFSSLQQIMEEKLPLLAQLEQHGKERARALREKKLSADLEGLKLLAAQSEQGEDLLSAGERLNELLQSCKAANLRNGRVIRSNQKSTEKMLCILRGNETPSLYDSTGGTAKMSGTRPLSQA